MTKNMCPACSLRAQEDKLAYVKAERDRWDKEEGKLEMILQAEQDRIEEEFGRLGYEQEPDCSSVCKELRHDYGAFCS